ncbi:MAG: GNAT family N-acetyltransferase [Pseudomonadota bacterium]
MHARSGRASGTGLGRVIEIAKGEGLRALALNAQTQAVGLYARYGFPVEGGEFLDDGIPHLCMRCLLE